MKKIMIAGLGLSLLSGTAVFAQNSSAGATSGQNSGTMDNGNMSGKKHKKHKKSKKSDNMGTENSTTAPKQ